jgi:hypothetical protein
MTDSTKFYEVIQGLLFAGECPWEIPMKNSHVIDLMSIGIRDFITLRDDVNIPQITSKMNGLCFDFSLLQYPIRDFSVPESDMLEEILDILQENIKSHKTTYVSCAKGLGRTGLVISCFLADYYRISNEKALKLMNEKRIHGMFQIDSDSPETQEQINYVLNWKSFTINEV